MLAKLAYAVAAVLFVVAVVHQGDTELLLWGLAAFAAGHVLDGITP